MFTRLPVPILFWLLCSTCFASYSVNELSLEEKVGQLLMVHFNGEVVNDDAKALVQELHVGGVIYYNWANGLHSPEQVLSLSSSLQTLAKQNPHPIPLLIAADQEGGLVARLEKGFTIFPGNRALGMTGKPELAEQSAFAMGLEMLSVGVNMSLSPVVDVNNNPHNPVIGIRSYGDSAETVADFAANALAGYHRAGILTSLKHFPGHGDVDMDSHQDLPLVKKSKHQLDEMELLPFSRLVAQADTVMTAHLVVPSLDPTNCATLSKPILDLLREEMHFKGVIITDSLVMKGLLKNCSSIDEAAIRALNAGCDILLLGGKQLIGTHHHLELTITDVRRIHRSLVQAVTHGYISQERLDEAVQRILTLKNRYHLENQKHTLNASEHQPLAQKIATQALQVKENEPLPSVSPLNLAIFAPTIIKDAIHKTSFLQGKENSSTLFFKGLNPTENEFEAAQEHVKEADFLIFFSYNAWKNETQAALIASLITLDKPLILVCLRDPQDATLFPKATLVLTTFSPTLPSIQAACEHLRRYFQ